MAQEHSRLKKVIHAMGDGVLVTDSDGIIVLHNPPACRLLGRADQFLLGLLIRDLAPLEICSMMLELSRCPPGFAGAVEARIERIGDIRVRGSPVHLGGVSMQGP